MDNIWGLFLVFFGGGTGSVFRYLVEKMVFKQTSNDFPFATLLVNLIGSFLIGVLFVGMDKYSILSSHRLFLATGFLGGFTTFSTFTLQSVNMIRNESYVNAMANIVLSIILGLVFVLIGIFSARLFLKD